MNKLIPLTLFLVWFVLPSEALALNPLKDRVAKPLQNKDKREKKIDLTSTTLRPGITKHKIYTTNERGQVIANALEIDLSNKNISIMVGLPDKKKIKVRDKLTNIVKSTMAYAGINANYFDVNVGNPLGTLITEGSWLTSPVYDRVAIGFSEDKNVFINQVMLTGNTTAYRGFRKKPFVMFEIDGLNTPPHLFKKAGLYTTHWDKELTLGTNTIGLIVKNGCVKKIVEEGQLEIPKNGYALAGSKNYILSYIKKRDCLKTEWQSNPNWSSVTEAVSGGPYLIMNGEIYIDEASQNFNFAKKEVYAPRSAIGVGKSGRLYLVAVDGRRRGYSEGLTLRELAELLMKLDIKEAINLDGGGSTELVVGGEIINMLSEHHERKISNGLLIFYKN